MFENNHNRGRCLVTAAFFRGGWLTLFFTLLAALIIDLQAQPKHYTLPSGKESVELPFVKVNNLILVPVMLEGIVPLWFILDTGVRSTILTERFVTDLLNIEYIRKYTLQAAGNMQQVEAYLTEGTSMKMGEIQIEGEPLLVLDEDYLELSKQLGMQVHGIMGHDIFKRFVVKIDYIKGVITFTEPEGFKPPRGYKKIPLEVEN